MWLQSHRPGNKMSDEIPFAKLSCVSPDKHIKHSLFHLPVCISGLQNMFKSIILSGTFLILFYSWHEKGSLVSVRDSPLICIVTRCIVSIHCVSSWICFLHKAKVVLYCWFPFKFTNTGWVAGFNFPLCVLSQRRPDGTEEHREHLLHERRPAGLVQLVRCSLPHSPSCLTLSYIIILRCIFHASLLLLTTKRRRIISKINWSLNWIIGVFVGTLRGDSIEISQYLGYTPSARILWKAISCFFVFSFSFQPSALLPAVNKRWSLFIWPEWWLSENCCSAPFEAAEAAFCCSP